MRKIILLASALALGGVAYAQDTTQPPTTTDSTSGAPAASGQMGDQSTMPTAPDASTPPMSGDATGTPPASGGMATPDQSTGGSSSMGTDPNAGGMNNGAPAGSATGPNGPVSMTPTQGPTDLPMCSKTVTDNCKQGAGKSSGGHHAMRHRGKK